MARFNIEISYSQISVFNGRLAEPFNDWSPDHVAQGFSWRPESVAFMTLIDAGPVDAEVRIEETSPNPSGARAIRVPFECPEDGVIEIASITDGVETSIPPGRYALLFETGMQEDQCWCRLTFTPDPSATPAVLIADGELHPSDPLLMEAEPA
ncbi:competence protein ComJ [Bremerella sp. JC817]|uniref:competence protein ComJ n=1 Tax=Bremerella sp. JC817 TaxID=3231756 RepID=UPI00345B40C8